MLQSHHFGLLHDLIGYAQVVAVSKQNQHDLFRGDDCDRPYSTNASIALMQHEPCR
jgi:hypothetical protein